MKIGNLRIGSRLYLGFGLVMLLTVAMGVTAILGMLKLANLTSKMYHYPLTVSNAVRDVKTNINAMHRSMKDVALAGDTEEVKKTARIVDDYEKAVFKSFDTVFERFLGNQRDVKNAHQAFSDWKIIRDEVIQLSLRGEKDRAAGITKGKAARHVDFMHNKIQVMTELASNQADAFFSDAKSTRTRVIRNMVIILAIILIAGLVIAFFITRSITLPVYEIIDIVKNIANGRLDQKIVIRRNDEIAELSESVNQMVDNFAGFARQADVIATGDYSINIALRSEKDVLGIAMQKMTESLRTAVEKNKREDWLKTGMNLLNEKMRGELSETELAENVITFLADRLDAQVGALYVAEEENGGLRFLRGYAFKKPADFEKRIETGEGLIGQAACEKKLISVKNLPANYMRIGSSMGDALPRHAVVAPFIFDDRLIGVIELGAFREFSEAEMELLRLSMEGIAISFNFVRTNAKLKQLLNETLRQGVELEAQSEKLRQSNEDLQTQTKLLKKQKREIERNAGEIAQKAKELELSGKYKSEFLANMSHEIRNPLNSMLILSQGLSKNRDGNLTENQVESVQTIYKGGKELLELINDLLDLSRVEAGRVHVDLKKVKTKAIADGITGGFKSMAEDKGLEWAVAIAKDTPDLIFTDKHRVEQILRNFISNAVKFTEKGRITLNFKKAPGDSDLARSGLKPENTIMISVTDTGIGIPPEKQKIIFNAFQQGDGSISRKYGGTGLGLSISSELAALLGGEIQLSSREATDERPGGSTFTVCLSVKALDRAPLERVKSGLPPHKQNKNRKLYDMESQLKDKKILLVEDDMKSAFALSQALREIGIITEIADDGLTALELLEKQADFELVLMDIMMPVMDGYETMRRIRKQARFEKLPIIALTARAIPEDHTECIEAGANDYITKPVDINRLILKMQNWLYM